MKKTFYISTPIYYPSGKPHLGHAYSTIIADVLARYKKLFGYEICFVTGTDEHGQKIETNAKKANLTPKQYVDNFSSVFVNLWTKLGINYTHFVRTTNINHEEAVQKAFSQLLNDGHIYLDKWRGYYCVSCEENITDSDIVNDNGTKRCKIGHELAYRDEESYFLKVSNQVAWLKQFYADHPGLVIPEDRIKELTNNFLNDLTDLSISRATFSWGVPIRENPKHVVYVWLDALLSYLTPLGYNSDHHHDFDEFWQNPDGERVHLMSKEITRFHCIYWPIMLKYLNLNEPTTILSHGWIVTKEGKMSKSLGNVIDPVQVCDKFSRDALRYYLIKALPTDKDGVFNEDLLIELFNADLANNIGNLASRLIGMLNKYCDGIVPVWTTNQLADDAALDELISSTISNIYQQVSSFQLGEAAKSVIELVKEANKYIENNKPWELYKNGAIAQLNNLLAHLAYVAYVTTNILSPILIDGSQAIATQLNFSLITDWESLTNVHVMDNVKVNPSVPVYNRINITK